MFNSQCSIPIRTEGGRTSPIGPTVRSYLASGERVAIRHPLRLRIAHWELNIGQILGLIRYAFGLLTAGRSPHASLFVAAALVVAIGAAVSTASAQQWYVETQVGRIRSALDPFATGAESVVDMPNVLAGARYDHPFGGLYIAAGLPSAKQEPVWGAVAGWKRLTSQRDGVFVGLDLAGNGFLLQDRVERKRQVPALPGTSITERVPSINGRAVAGQALPVLGFGRAGFEVRGRAGVSHYASWFGAEERQRTVQLADVQVTFAPESSFAITPVVRGYRAEEGAYTYAGVTGIAGHGKTSLWGAVGQWLGRGAHTGAPWAAGATLRVHPRFTLNASHRHDTADPLYSSPPKTSWGVGISIQVSGPTRPPPQPLPAAYVGGRATIHLPTSQSATPPRIAGDFNNWQPQPMDRASGHWTYTVALAPGVYNYAFVNEQGEWFVPKNVPGRRDDGMGGHVAVLVVR